jgi:hypothetical protein
MAPTRGNAISAYSPAFSKGAQVYAANIASGAVTSAKLGSQAVTNAKMKAAFLSGTLVSGQTTRAIAHGLGVKPKSVIVVPILTLAQGISAKVPSIVLAAASAATSANFYVIGSQASNAALKYAAYVQI